MKKHLIFIVQSITVGLALAFVYLWSTGRISSIDDNAPSQIPETGHSYAKAVQTIAPAVVGIYVQSQAQIPNTGTNPGVSPRAPYVTRNYVGSGVVVSSDGHIVTNHHVTDNASRIYVTLWNNDLYEAKMVGSDKDTDLAVIKIEAQGLTTGHFADSEHSNTGDVVLAIGNPYGLNQSVSLGIISATGRKGLNISSYENFIQTDAAVNPGNSGGPLLNMLGEIVGINTFMIRDGENIGFSLPINYLKKTIEEYGKGEGRSGARCMSCSNMVFDTGKAQKYCPHCGTKLTLPAYEEDYEPVGISKTIEELSAFLGVKPEQTAKVVFYLARKADKEKTKVEKAPAKTEAKEEKVATEAAPAKEETK